MPSGRAARTNYAVGRSHGACAESVPSANLPSLLRSEAVSAAKKTFLDTQSCPKTANVTQAQIHRFRKGEKMLDWNDAEEGEVL